MNLQTSNENPPKLRHELLTVMSILETAIENLCVQPDSVKAKKLYKSGLKCLRSIRKKYTKQK